MQGLPSEGAVSRSSTPNRSSLPPNLPPDGLARDEIGRDWATQQSSQNRDFQDDSVRKSIAQYGCIRFCKPKVGGSIPSTGTSFPRHFHIVAIRLWSHRSRIDRLSAGRYGPMIRERNRFARTNWRAHDFMDCRAT